MRLCNSRKAAQWSLLAVFSALLLCQGARGQRQVSLQATDSSDVVTSSTYLDTAGSTDSGSSAAPTPTSSTLPIGSAAVSTVDDDDDPSAAASAWQPPPTQSATVPSPNGAYPNPQWSSLLGKTLYFYDIQRAGQLPSNFRVQWRDSSSTSDGSDEGLDLTKGFFDAGNFIKATLPLSWTLQQLAWAGAMYGESFDSTGQTKYLNRTMRVGLDWLLEASSKPDTVVVQVGRLDDNYWGPASGIPQNRPSYTVTRDNPGTDIFAAVSATMALGALLYSGTAIPAGLNQNGTVASLRDDAYASRLQQRAISMMQLAQSATPQQVYQKAQPYGAQAYPSSDFNDELILAATWLAALTGQQQYAQYALDVFNDNGFPWTSGALNWDSKVAATPVAMLQAAVLRPELSSVFNVDTLRDKSEVWLDAAVDNKMSSFFYTPGALPWWKGDSDGTSMNPMMNAAFLSAIYGPFARGSKVNKYAGWTNFLIDYVLGKNPMNTVYVIGASPNSPLNAHSSMASGGRDISEIDTSPPVMAHTLWGGVLGGPDRKDRFFDQRSDYTQSEPTVDLVSPMVFLSAQRIATRAADPYYVSNLADKPRKVAKRPKSSSQVALEAALPTVLIVLALAIAGFVAFKKRDTIRQWSRQRRMKKIGVSYKKEDFV